MMDDDGNEEGHDDGDAEMFQPSSAQPARTMLTGQVEQNGLAKYVGEYWLLKYIDVSLTSMSVSICF